MEIKIVSDAPDVLRLQVAERIVRSDPAPDSDHLGELLGSEGYARHVLLSLEKTQYVDSSGLSWLVVRHKRFAEAGGKLVLHSVPPSVGDVLRMMRLDLVLDIAQDEAAALESVRGAGP